MTQNLGIEKVLAIPALSASYGKLPNALARARNEKVACSSQVTSSKNEPRNRDGFGVLLCFPNILRSPIFAFLPNVQQMFNKSEIMPVLRSFLQHGSRLLALPF